MLFPLGRVCLGQFCLWCVAGGCLDMSRHAGGLAWVLCHCVWSSHYFVGYGGLLRSHVRYVAFSFVLMCLY